MTGHIEIRASTPGDLPALKLLYQDAFPTEDLLPLVMDLLQNPPATISQIGTIGSTVVGHVMFTRCGVSGTGFKVALLGPLAVASAWQKQGIGSSLVRNGLQRLENDAISAIYVLGDPAYYRRFGFAPEANVTPPYPLPAQWREAWQSIEFGTAERRRHGELTVPTPWLKPALWAP